MGRIGTAPTVTCGAFELNDAMFFRWRAICAASHVPLLGSVGIQIVHVHGSLALRYRYVMLGWPMLTVRIHQIEKRRSGSLRL